MHGREFGAASIKQGMSEHMVDYLDNQQKKFTEWVECPSHFMKEPEEPVAL